jgi:hypothetical protein
MALSDYLTSKEWDACFYLSFGKHSAPNFGASMHLTVDYFLSKGYRFEGLDEKGERVQQVENGVNAPKVLIFMGNPYNLDVEKVVRSGREFVKERFPELLQETDEEFEMFMEDVQRRRDLEK